MDETKVSVANMEGESENQKGYIEEKIICSQVTEKVYRQVFTTELKKESHCLLPSEVGNIQTGAKELPLLIPSSPTNINVCFIWNL